MENTNTTMGTGMRINEESLSSILNTSFDLSPNGARLRAKSLKYEGDPDLHPIKSNENAFLVRMLYTLAQKINDAVCCFCCCCLYTGVPN